MSCIVFKSVRCFLKSTRHFLLFAGAGFVLKQMAEGGKGNKNMI